MFDPKSISLNDITSTVKNGQVYVKENLDYQPEFKEYTPKTKIVDKIRAWLEKKNEKLIIRAFGATWCGDCKIQLPRLVKIATFLDSSLFEVGILGQIKTKPPYNRKEGKLIWKSPPSPKEAVDTRFDMFHIPAIFLFLKDGTCIGKIDEKPEHTSSIEGDILHYLKIK